MPQRLKRDERQYQIYALIDPRDRTIRYVGKSDDVQYRYYQHLHFTGGRQEIQWIKELRTIGLSPALEILETINVADNANKFVLERERYWIDKLTSAGCPLLNVFGISRAYPQSKQSTPKIDTRTSINAPSDSWSKPESKPQSIASTDRHDFSKLINNMPANVSELARLSSVSKQSIMKMKNGEYVLRSTADRVLDGLTKIYGETFTVDNVRNIKIKENKIAEHAQSSPHELQHTVDSLIELPEKDLDRFVQEAIQDLDIEGLIDLPEEAQELDIKLYDHDFGR